MKVALFTTNLDPGAGWGRHSREIVGRLTSAGIEPIVFTERGTTVASLPGVRVHPVLDRYQRILRNPALAAADAIAVRALVRDCACVHALVEPHAATAALLARAARPLVITAVGTYAVSMLSARRRWVFGPAFRHARWIAAISTYTASRVIELAPSVTPRMEIVPLGVTMPSMASERPRAARRAPAFLSLGAVKRRKGTLHAIEALALVRRSVPGARLYVIGDLGNTAYVAECKRRAARLGIEEAVRWIGKIPDAEVEACYATIRGLVMPSLNHGNHFEGLGLVHLEANARGVPAIRSRGCGNEDAIQDGVTGYLVAQGDVATLADRMHALLVDDASWDRMSDAAIRFAQSMSWDRTARAYAALYQRSG